MTQLKLTYEDIAREIVTRCEPGRVNLVAIDGHGGAGKSFLAKKLAALLQAPIIEIDDFISWGDLTSWWPRFEEQVLMPLAHGKPARYQARDWEGDFLGSSLGDWKTVERAPIILLEGTGSSRQEIADQLTLAIWVDAPAEVCLSRGVERDGEEVRSKWIEFRKMCDEFFYEDNTRWRAEVTIDTDPGIPYDKETEVVLAEV